MLTIRRVERERRPGRYCDGHGLYLEVSKGGGKNWFFRWERTVDGKRKERWMGLGAAHTVTLDEARERARQARLLLLDGHDPLDVRARQRATTKTAKLVSFEGAAVAWHAAKEGGYRNAKHASQVISTLEAHAFPAFGNLPVAAIETPHVLAALKPIWAKTPETASRLRGRIEAVLNYATAAGYRSSERPNPARWKGHLDHLLAAPKKLTNNGNGDRHFPTLPYVEVPAFLTALSTRPGIAAVALKFLILTASRSGEVVGARKSEINFDERVWAIPGSRMKAGRQHEVPLSEPAFELLKALPTERGNDFVFPGVRRGSGLGDATMLTALKRMGYNCSVHGFRSSFRDWCADRTSFPREICEAALAHSIGSVEAAYLRSTHLEKRRQLMQHWADFCCAIARSEEVIDLNEARLRSQGGPRSAQTGRELSR